MSDQIPDRTFVDDLGRRWEWCGGEPGTWAWRITDEGELWASFVAESQKCYEALISSTEMEAMIAAWWPRITDRGQAVIESGLTLRQAHEIETGCTPDQLCDRCRKDIDALYGQDGAQ